MKQVHPDFNTNTPELINSFDSLYYEILAAADKYIPKTTLDNSETQPNPSQVSSQPGPNLPEVQIPKFDGTLHMFPAFRALYDSLIHSTKLTNIQKFSYLKSLLEGSALRSIETVTFVPDNYQIAYDLLIQTYTKKRVLAQHYLEKIFSLQPLHTNSPEALKELADTLQTSYTCLTSMSIDNLSDYLLLEFSLKLLDEKTRNVFEKQHLNTEFPKFAQLISHLRDEYSVSELTGSVHTDISHNNSFTKNPRNQFKQTPIRKRVTMTVNNSSNVNNFNETSQSLICPACSKNHKFRLCPQLSNLNSAERYELVKKHRRCFNCLGPHSLPFCRSKGKCRQCGSDRHNTLLHSDARSRTPHVTIAPPIQVPDTPNSSLELPQPSTCLANTCSKPLVLLGTAQALILNSNNKWIPCRLVLDPGSEINFISRSLAEQLGLPFQKCLYSITGIGQTPLSNHQGMISFTLSSRNNINTKFNFDAVVVPKITTDLPTTSLSPNIKARFSELTLADPEFFVSRKVDILLGVQAVMDITPTIPSQIKGQPSAILTSLGWVLMGNVNSQICSNLVCSTLLTASEPSLDSILRKFWEVEEVPHSILLSPEDLACEEHYKNTTTRTPSGRYITRLPFKDGKPPNLGSTRDLALNRLLKLEKRFANDPIFRDLYHLNIRDYISQGHLVPASRKASYILTHHGVLKTSAKGTSVRVVFNPAEKDPNGISLNSSLMSGQKLQSDLGLIITRFRCYKIALTCDVRQMFREISRHSDDRIYFHIFWRFSTTEPVREWEHTRVIFGGTSSPFEAQRTILQLLEDEGHAFPRASAVLRKSLYIDDCLGGSDTIHDVISLRNELISLFRRGGFELAKWASSEPTVLQGFVSPDNQPSVSIDSHNSIKVLGLLWNSQTDTLHYSISPCEETNTKRGILSRIARTYDINGYLSPVLFSLKCLLQSLWLQKIDWDEPLPDNVCSQWTQIITQFPSLSKVAIPRYAFSLNFKSAQLVGFSDASGLGMAAVVYLRIVTSDNIIKLFLIAAKTRVAPLKSWTIPKLELGAACLLSRLLKSVLPAYSEYSLQPSICFSDSMTTLSWIHSPPHTLKIFVSNRVVQILENVPTASWYFVSGRENPADIASRGLLPNDLLESDMWWKGPQFLYDVETNWSFDSINTSLHSPDEVKVSSKVLFVGFDESPFLNVIDNCSTLIKLQRVIAYLFRFTRNLINKYKRTPLITGSLTAREYDSALLFIVKVTQATYLKSEIEALSSNQLVSKKYRCLSPFLSPSGDLVMVGGRLHWSNLSTRSKHPYLIPHKSRLAILLCDYFHLFSGHGGPQLVQSLLHKQFWIPGARNLIRSRIFHCQRCYRFQGKPVQPPMSDLPNFRLQPRRCFAHTGIDCAGPFYVKTSLLKSARYNKCYFAIFVCMVSKAVHLETLTDLTTIAFIAALDRFIARRGLPSHIYTDQGSNFRGAARYITDLSELLKQSKPELSHFLASRGIEWTFNPSYAPHFGGLWESGVKSVKHHFRRVVGEQKLTLEQFMTIITKIEGILNSRPLCRLPSSPDDGFDYLTPGHLLTGGPLLCRPEEDVTKEPDARLARWQLTNKLIQSFWNRWTKEYIHTQIHRPKWHKQAHNFSPGDLVYWFVPGTPVSQWPLGRVLKVLPGKDGVSRVLKILTPSKDEVVRPATKVVPLPAE